MSPPNMPLWYKDYTELETIDNQKDQEVVLCPILYKEESLFLQLICLLSI
jgi:hypothetical protein